MSFFAKIILVLVLVFLLEIYFFKTVIKSIKIIFPRISSKKINLTKWFFIVIINFYPIIAIAAWVYVFLTKAGYFAPPDNIFFDYLVLYPFWIGMIMIVQATLFFLLFELIHLLFRPFTKNFKGKVIFLKSALFLATFLLSLVYVPLRIIYDYRSVDVREVIFEKKNLPAVLSGFKIAFVSDIQADKYTDEKRLTKFIKELNSTDPDLVLMAGDMITSTPNYIEFSAKQLSRINAKYGIYTCVGDHDNWAYRGDNERSQTEITNALAEENITMIDNNNLTLGIDSSTIKVTFVTNTYVETVSEKVLDSLSRNNNSADLKIFLTHQPREFLIEKAAGKKYDLYLCGHTHGGQITFLFPFYNLSPTMIETFYMRGDFWFDDMMMVVNRGLGMSLAPVRYNSTPEITVITLNNL